MGDLTARNRGVFSSEFRLYTVMELCLKHNSIFFVSNFKTVAYFAYPRVGIFTFWSWYAGNCKAPCWLSKQKLTCPISSFYAQTSSLHTGSLYLPYKLGVTIKEPLPVESGTRKLWKPVTLCFYLQVVCFFFFYICKHCHIGLTYEQKLYLARLGVLLALSPFQQ